MITQVTVQAQVFNLPYKKTATATSTVKYALSLILVLISARSSVFTGSDIFLVAVTLFALYKFITLRLSVDRPIIFLSAGYILLTAIYYIKFGYLDTGASVRFYIKILLAYAVIKITGKQFFSLFEKIIYQLSIISLVFFTVQFISISTILSLDKTILSILPFLQNPEGYQYSSWVIYSINFGGLDRNSGFMWEPGGFAAILIITLLISFTFSKFKLNKKIIVMLIALATTFSTTGYVAFGIVAVYLVFNMNKKYLFVLLPLLVIGGFALSKLDFITNKINKQFEDRHSNIQNLESFSGTESVSLGRFGSLIVDFEDFKKHYIVGIGLQDNERTKSVYTNLVHTNGLTIYLLMFGSVGLVYMIYNLNQSFKNFTQTNKTVGAVFFVLAVLIVAFSNPVLATPLFISFQVYYMDKQKDSVLRIAVKK